MTTSFQELYSRSCTHDKLGSYVSIFLCAFVQPTPCRALLFITNHLHFLAYRGDLRTQQQAFSPIITNKWGTLEAECRRIAALMCFYNHCSIPWFGFTRFDSTSSTEGPIKHHTQICFWALNTHGGTVGSKWNQDHHTEAGWESRGWNKAIRVLIILTAITKSLCLFICF